MIVTSLQPMTFCQVQGTQFFDVDVSAMDRTAYYLPRGIKSSSSMKGALEHEHRIYMYHMIWYLEFSHGLSSTKRLPTYGECLSAAIL
jgi:hypothetical protein